MKVALKILIVSYLLVNKQLSSAQVAYDKLILVDKTSIECKVLRVTENSIEIDPKGSIPFQNIDRNKVDYIIYSDNTVVKFHSAPAEKNIDTTNIAPSNVLKGEHLTLGLSKFNQEDFEGAIQEFDKEIASNPTSLDGYKYRALANWQKDDQKGAIADFEKALKIDKYDESVLQLYGVFLANVVGDGKGALEKFDTVIELNPSHKLAYLERGKTEYLIAINLNNATYSVLTNFYTRAYADLSKSIELDSKLGEAYFYRGEVIHITGRKKNACIDYKKALELGYEKALESVQTFCK
jgi:tetratricopeptide (TPR) repeat protein